MRVRRYQSTHVLDWSKDFGGNGGQAHLTADNNYVWVCDAINRLVYRRIAADGTGAGSFGGSGSTDGKFGTGGPYGICNDGTYLYVTDPGNSRLQKFTLAGAYVAQWAVPSGAHGCAVDGSGNVLVSDVLQGTVRRYTNTGTFIDSFTQTAPAGVAVASGDVVWVTNATDGTVAKWDEQATLGGYGAIAFAIDGNLSDYMSIGEREGAVANVHGGTATGPGTCLVRAFGKATSGTLTLEGAVLDATATPRR